MSVIDRLRTIEPHRRHRVVLVAAWIASAVALFIGATQRWVACTPEVIFDDRLMSASCNGEQDHLHDFWVTPMEPWSPLGAEAWWGGIAIVLWGVGVPSALYLLSRGWQRVLTRLIGLGTVAIALVCGAGAFLSAAGVIAGIPGSLASVVMVWLVIVWPAWAVVLGVADLVRASGGRVLLAALAVAVFSPGTYPMLVTSVALLGFGSWYDAAAWNEAVLAFFLAALAVIVVALAPPRTTPTSDSGIGAADPRRVTSSAV